jgi:NAD(P)-dependent dehydrogenase (short-subunit alcohol dehydrogenase family)
MTEPGPCGTGAHARVTHRDGAPKTRAVSHGRFQNPVQATLTGLKDLVGRQPMAAKLTDDLRLDGRTCLVTGASSGVGFAVAAQLAERGGRVLMLSRSGIPEKGDAVRARAPGAAIEQHRVDLSDLDAIDAFCDGLAERGERIDVLVDNAGIATPRARRSAQGFDAMFATNVLAKAALARRLLEDGVIANRTFGSGRPDDAPVPRMIYVSSDSHRGASAIDWPELGTYYEYGVNKGIGNYSYFKLVMNTWATELARRLAGGPGEPLDVAVHVMCPGPVNTNIARDAPPALHAFMRLMFKAFFRDPEVAARPAVYQCVSPELGRETNRYLHMFLPKRMDPKCYDEAEGERIWAWMAQTLERRAPPERPA